MTERCYPILFVKTRTGNYLAVRKIKKLSDGPIRITISEAGTHNTEMYKYSPVGRSVNRIQSNEDGSPIYWMWHKKNKHWVVFEAEHYDVHQKRYVYAYANDTFESYATADVFFNTQQDTWI